MSTFIKMLHGLQSSLRKLSNQLWTKDNVPVGTQTLHDFNDGEGLVPAIPVDIGSFNNDIINLNQRKVDIDNSSFSNDIINLNQRKVDIDNSSFSNDIIEFIVTQNNPIGEPIIGH